MKPLMCAYCSGGLKG